MFLSIAILSRYQFNQRRLTETDFYAICEKRGVIVRELDVETSFYLSLLGKEVIVIDRKLTGVKREFAMFHELSHCLLSVPSNQPQALFMGMCDSKEEDNADAFACIALIPIDRIWDASFKDDCCCGFATTIYEKRLKLYQMYNL